MSLQYRLYVGPYAKCEHPLGEYEGFDDRLIDLRGELYSIDNGIEYFGPNQGLSAMPRKLFFSEGNEIVVSLSNALIREQELEAFSLQYRDAINELRVYFGKVKLDWGIVPGVS